MSFFIPSSRTPVCQLINPVVLYHKHDFVSTVMRSFAPFRHTGHTVVPGISPVSAGEPKGPEGEDDFHCAFKWRGSPDEGWFSITQSTDAGMNVDAQWEILAGGEVDSGMAFRAIIADGGVPQDYYIVTTLDNIESATPEEVVPVLSADMPDYDEGALAFIDEANDLCLGFLNSYPTQLSDVVWAE